MNLVTRDIFFTFIKTFFLVIVSFTVLFYLMDLVDKGDKFLSKDVSHVIVTSYLLYKTPLILTQIFPIALLLTTLVVINQKNKNNEITAIKASGVNIYRILSPIFIFAVLIAYSSFLLSEKISPITLKKAKDIEATYIKGIDKRLLSKKGLLLKQGNSIYKISSLNVKEKHITSLIKYTFSGDFVLQEMTETKDLFFKDEVWQSESALVTKFNKEDSFTTVEVLNYKDNYLKSPANLTTINFEHEQMSFDELETFIEEMEAKGENTDKYRTDLYSKMTFPFINILVVFLALPFAMRTGRHGSITWGIALCLVISFSYWIVFGLFIGLGKASLLPPLLAAISTNIIFFFITAYTVSFVRQ